MPRVGLAVSFDRPGLGAAERMTDRGRRGLLREIPSTERSSRGSPVRDMTWGKTFRKGIELYHGYL
jgi:hypothetical protein